MRKLKLEPVREISTAQEAPKQTHWWRIRDADTGETLVKRIHSYERAEHYAKRYRQIEAKLPRQYHHFLDQREIRDAMITNGDYLPKDCKLVLSKNIEIAYDEREDEWYTERACYGVGVVRGELCGMRQGLRTNGILKIACFPIAGLDLERIRHQEQERRKAYRAWVRVSERNPLGLIAEPHSIRNH